MNTDGAEKDTCIHLMQLTLKKCNDMLSVTCEFPGSIILHSIRSAGVNLGCSRMRSENKSVVYFQHFLYLYFINLLQCIFP